MALSTTPESEIKMNLSNPIQVINLKEFLPLDGENRVEICYIDGGLNIDIYFEKDGMELIPDKLRLSFSNVAHFFKSPFPGYSFFSCSGDRELSLLHSVVEYAQSDLVDLEQKRAGGAGLKHYRLFLHSTGNAIHVIAKSCGISK